MDMMLNVSESQIGQVISARELYNFLEIKSHFKDWSVRRIEKYKFLENADFIAHAQKRAHASGRDYEEIDYLITMDMAKELSMIENNEQGRQARKYFISCEKKYVELLQTKLDILEKGVVVAELEYVNTDWGMKTMKNNLMKVELIEKEIDRLVDLVKPLYEEMERVSYLKHDSFFGMYGLFRDEESEGILLKRDAKK